MPSLSNYALLTAAPGSGTRYNPSRPGAFQWDILKRAYVVPQTGALYTGPLGTTGSYSINGQHSATPPTDPNAAPDFSVTHTVRQPAIAALTDVLTKQSQTQATATGTDLSRTLPGLEDIATRSYSRSQAATDTAPLEAQLTGSMTAQEKAQRDIATQQGQRNKDFAAETEAMLSKLSAENANWEARTNAIGERAGAAAITNASLIPLNPKVRSGAQPSRVAVALANALLPTQQAISARRYAQVAQIEQPWRQNLYAQDSALIASNQALESSFGGNWRAIYQYIQGVKQQASQMDAANAERYIAQALALKRVPAEFLSNQISMASALQRLDDAATEHLVSQNVDTSQFVGGPAFSAPGIDRSYRPGTPNPNVMPRGNAQDGTGPNARGWRDWNQSGAVGAPMPPAGTLEGDIARGLPDWALDQRYGEDRTWRTSARAPSIPFDPNYTSGGWGYANGEYIGANADWYNEAVYGPVVSPYE